MSTHIWYVLTFSMCFLQSVLLLDDASVVDDIAGSSSLLDDAAAGVAVALRKDMWQIVEGLRRNGTTIILTTHYIEEAELMADRVGVIRKGKILMVDDKDAMMAKLGNTEALIELAEPMTDLPEAIKAFPVELRNEGREICYRGGSGEGGGRAEVADLTKALIREGIDYTGLDIHDSSLEDIFVDLVAGSDSSGDAS